MQMNKTYISQLKATLPNLTQTIDRLAYLSELKTNTQDGNMPRVVVFGLYNHGKSTLLNALVGEERSPENAIFKAADIRETRSIQTYRDRMKNIVWVDTPGLQADEEDNDTAVQAAITYADILLVVHNIKEGELLPEEIKHFKDLFSSTTTYTEKLLVLTQIDQVNQSDVKEIEDFNNKKNRINEQLKGLSKNIEVYELSAIDYQKFKHKGEKVANSTGVPALLDKLEKVKKTVMSDREYSERELKSIIRNALNTKLNNVKNNVANLIKKTANEKTLFAQDVKNTLEKIKAI